MNTDKPMRRLLFVAALFNFGAALMFAFPTSLGTLAALPPAPTLYTALVALFVAQFGVSYAWLALQPSIHRPLLAFGAIGKASASVLFFSLWLVGHASLLVMLGGLGDLAFAAVFVAWLRASAVQPGVRPHHE
ncbi:MAG: hypothetical protein ACT4PZ_08740 [Panacagrimonas sp.]